MACEQYLLCCTWHHIQYHLPDFSVAKNKSICTPTILVSSLTANGHATGIYRQSQNTKDVSGSAALLSAIFDQVRIGHIQQRQVRGDTLTALNAQRIETSSFV